MKVALSAGHYPKARGACYAGVCEHELAIEWAHLLTVRMPRNIAIVHVPTGTLRQKVDFINEARVDLAVEIHFNAGGGEGAETLYAPGSANGKQAARCIQRMLALCGLRDRGIKEGWYKQDRPGIVDYHGDVDGDEKIDYFLRATTCPAVIIEPEFIERNDTFPHLREYAPGAIALGIADYLRR